MLPQKSARRPARFERDERYYSQNRPAILAQQRIYNRRQAELLAEERRFGVNGAASIKTEETSKTVDETSGN